MSKSEGKKHGLQEGQDKKWKFSGNHDKKSRGVELQNLSFPQHWGTIFLWKPQSF